MIPETWASCPGLFFVDSSGLPRIVDRYRAQRAFLSGPGAWALHDLAPGPYTVVARSPQGRASLAIEVAKPR